MSHRSFAELNDEIKKAREHVSVGGLYSHYKHPQNLYRVVGLAIQEATDKVCVIYQPQKNKQTLWIRDLDNWLEKPVVDGKVVDRFRLVTE